MRMPSFDTVSEINPHELANAVDQANREVANRFDFKGTESRFERDETVITVVSESEFQLQQMLEILRNKITKRDIELSCLKIDPVVLSEKTAKQTVTCRQGIDATLAKQIVKAIKDSKIKVDASIQGDKVRIAGKKKDDLQLAIALLRQQKFELPLQFNNFRD
jgi:cyclic-di-GMP-binding protein